MMDFRTGASHANDKRLELGLVFPDCIEWRRWTPGMEYNKMLYIKNVTRKVMIVHWVPPPTCFFNLNFEDPVRLNPGATAALQVVFKPVKSQLYESKIEFFTLKGNFSINLKGSIPRVQLEVPASLDFGVCFVNDICERKFEVMNSGEEPITLKWNVDSPFLLFPAMATLGSGHSATIMGRFEPVQPGAYAAMAFCEPDLSSILQIRLNGIAKYSCLTISQYSLKFEDVMVKSSKRMDLQVHNISEVAVHFWIESAGKPLHHMESVFLAQPSKGTVVANGSITLEVIYTPLFAGTFSIEQFNVLTQSNVISFTCSGNAARPLVKSSSFSLDFGSVELGSSSCCSLSLENASKSEVIYQFVTEELGVFGFKQSRGVIYAHSKVTVQIRFSPIEPMNYYKRLVCILQNQHPLYCELVGSCYKGLVKSSTLMCYNINRDRTYARNFHVEDIHRGPTAELFGQTAQDGKLASDSTMAVPCLSLSANSAIAANGTAVFSEIDSEKKSQVASEAVAPIQLNQTSISAKTQIGVYSTATPIINTGLHANSKILEPNVINETKSTSSLEPGTYSNTQLHKVKRFSKLFQATAAVSAHDVWREYFVGRTSILELITMDFTHLDFAACSCSQPADSKYINVTNISGIPLSCVWVVQPEAHFTEKSGYQKITQKMRSFRSSICKSGKIHLVFQVVPDKVELAVGATLSFEVLFQPLQDHMYYHQYLNCFMYPSYDMKIHIPNAVPWSTYVEASGHTFESIAREYFPQAVLSTTRVCFAPALIGTYTYQTILLQNRACTSLKFMFECQNTFSKFLVKPMQGIVPGNHFQIISFQFHAEKADDYMDTFICRLNNSADDLILTVLGSSQLPRVEFEKSCISFSPTNIGRKELRPVVILNLSGIPVSFSWNIPLKLARVFSMTPMKGYLQGMERLQVSCTFCPQNDVRYISEVTCVVTALTEEAFYHDHSINIAHKSSDLETRVSLKITAAGVRAVITVEPKTLDFGVQRVGAAHTRKLTLYNSTEGVLEYSLKCFPMGDLKEETYEINFDNPHGLVHALSFEEVIVSMKAYKALTFGAQIICLTDGAGSEELNFTCQKEATESCLLSAIAAYPSVIISGIRSDRLSTVQLWKQIQVDKLNDLLTNCSIDPSRRLTQPQMLFGLGTPLENSFPFIFEFGAQNIGCLATIIDIVLECHVALPVVWKIRTWNDKEVDMGHWVEEGDPTKEESTLLTIRSMKLFEIEPSQGYLEPFQRMLVKFTYKHAIGGCHSIPVSFEVENGYSIDITLSGKTLPISHKILGLQAASCTLDPIVVGQMNLVLQTFEIRNDGLLEFEYRLDTTPLEELQRQNFGFKVLWCLNASGSIPPMKTVLLQWLFQPLEVRVYALDIPILIDEGESLVLHLEGVGLPPSSEHKSVKGGAYRSHHQISSQSGKVFSWPGVPVALSTDFIDLGRVPELSSKEKLLTVHNLLETYAITFFWRSTLATEKSIDGKLSVFPQSGIVKPGRSCLCKMKILVGTELQDFLVTLKCDVNVVNEENQLNVFQRHPKERKLSNSLCEEVIVCNRKRLGTESSSRKFWHSCVPHAFTETLKSAMPSKVSTSVNDYPIPFKTLYLSVACAISGFSNDPGTPKCLLQASHLLHKMVPCNSIKSLKNIKFDFVKSFLLELLRESVCEAVIKTPTVVNKNACLYYEQLQSNQVIGGETESSSFQSNNLQYAPNDDIMRDGIPTGIPYENKYVKPPHANEIPVALSNPKVDCLSRSCQYASENELDKSFLSNSMIMAKAVLEDAIYNVISGLINDDYTLLLKG